MSHKYSKFSGTDARRDDSVLFSLDSLSKLVPNAAPLRTRPATPAPASEGSGLIDIRTMSAMLQRDAAPKSNNPMVGNDGLPGFAGHGLDGLSTAALANEVETVQVVASQAARPSQGPMYVVLGLLGAGLLALGAMIILDEPAAPQVVTQYVAEPGPVEVGAVVPPVDEQHAEAGAGEGERAREAEVEVAAAPTRETAGPRKPRTRDRARTNTASDASKPTTTDARKPAKQQAIDVDCLLDQNLEKCGKSEPKQPTAPPPTKPPAETREQLPNKLSQTAILDGINPVKTAAKSCGSGTTVEIKFSVAGETGKVISAVALGEHANSAVGRCVVTAAKAARFDRFAAQQQGLNFKFRL